MFVKMFSNLEKINIPKDVSVKIEDRLITLSTSNLKASVKMPKVFKAYLSEERSLVLSNSLHPEKITKRTFRKLVPMRGTLRAKILRAISSLSSSFSREINIVGVGYKVELLSPNTLSLKLGYSHDIVVGIPKNVDVVCPKETLLIIKSSCNESLGAFVALLKKCKTPDVYKNKGVLVKGEVLEKKKFKKK